MAQPNYFQIYTQIYKYICGAKYNYFLKKKKFKEGAKYVHLNPFFFYIQVIVSLIFVKTQVVLFVHSYY